MGFLQNYSIQHWLESCPQGYLEDTYYGHHEGEVEPTTLLEDELLRNQAIRTTVQLVVGERAALAASSGLINCAPDHYSKCFLSTQTLDEARHVEIFTRRLNDLGIKAADLEDVIERFANPNLVKFAEILLEKVDKKDFIAGVVGQNIILEGMAFSVFELLRSTNQQFNPKFAHTLDGTIADERRHVGFGENRIGALIQQYPERRAEVEGMQRDMSYHMLATFAGQLRTRETREEIKRVKETAAEADADPERTKSTWKGKVVAELTSGEIESLLSDTVLGEFKKRLGRIGLEYQTPTSP